MKKPLTASEMGRRGGQVTSARKAAAVRENGKKGGRPKKPLDFTPRCYVCQKLQVDVYDGNWYCDEHVPAPF